MRCRCPIVLFADLTAAWTGGWWHRRCGGWLPPEAYTPPAGKPMLLVTRLRRWWSAS